MTIPNPAAAVRYTAIDGYLKALKMPGALREYRTLAREIATPGADPLALLEAVLAQELESRHRSQIIRRMQDARFPYAKTLDTFDFTAAPKISQTAILDLARAQFVDLATNVVFIGPSGTGKTHLAIGIGRAAIHQGHRVRFTGATNLMNELLSAQAAHELPRFLKTWSRYSVVIVDEIGFVPFSADGARLLFQFFADMYERRSLIVTTNLEFSHWVDVFGDPVMTSALLDRLTHRAQMIVTEGESYRLRQALAQRSRGHESAS